MFLGDLARTNSVFVSSRDVLNLDDNLKIRMSSIQRSKTEIQSVELFVRLIFVSVSINLDFPRYSFLSFCHTSAINNGSICLYIRFSHKIYHWLTRGQWR